MRRSSDLPWRSHVPRRQRGPAGESLQGNYSTVIWNPQRPSGREGPDRKDFLPTPRRPELGSRRAVDQAWVALLRRRIFRPNPDDRVVADVDHPLLERDDRVVGDADPLGAHLGAALRDFAGAIGDQAPRSSRGIAA